jgi:hypothetical protein
MVVIAMTHCIRNPAQTVFQHHDNDLILKHIFNFSENGKNAISLVQSLRMTLPIQPLQRQLELIRAIFNMK